MWKESGVTTRQRHAYEGLGLFQTLLHASGSFLPMPIHVWSGQRYSRNLLLPVCRWGHETLVIIELPVLWGHDHHLVPKQTYS